MNIRQIKVSCVALSLTENLTEPPQLFSLITISYVLWLLSIQISPSQILKTSNKSPPKTQNLPMYKSSLVPQHKTFILLYEVTYKKERSLFSFLWRVRIVCSFFFPNTIKDHFTVFCLVTWPMHGSEAGVDLVLIETSLLLLCKCNLFALQQLDVHNKNSEVYQNNKINSSLTAIQRPGH